jgi:hypothetical protein
MRIACVIFAALMACGCLHEPPATTSTPHQTSTNGDELAPIRATTVLTYTRSGMPASAIRPVGFTLIRDYRNSTAAEELPGRWNDATQTLAADVTITLRSENLVFVDDVGANPGAPMVITAGRGGRLREVACPESVSPEHACYLLQLLR